MPQTRTQNLDEPFQIVHPYIEPFLQSTIWMRTYTSHTHTTSKRTITNPFLNQHIAPFFNQYTAPFLQSSIWKRTYTTHTHTQQKDEPLQTHFSSNISHHFSNQVYECVYMPHTCTQHQDERHYTPKSPPTYRTTSPIVHPYTEPLLYPHTISNHKPLQSKPFGVCEDITSSII